jgi:uncharacterized membrane protein YkvA (DUF1232 family)
MLQQWKTKAKLIKREIYTLYIAYGKKGVPWYAKAFGALVVAYAFSPIDLIPDFIPVLGYLDDLILLPLGISLAIKMIPETVLVEARAEAALRLEAGHPQNWIAGGIIIVLWLIVIMWVIFKVLGWN